MAAPAAETAPPEVDSLSILVVVDNITDALSLQPPAIKHVNDFARVVSQSASKPVSHDGDHPDCPEMDFACLCDAAHGYSVLITARRGATERTVLFDAGPHPRVFKTNSELLGIDFSKVDGLFLSHWHVDHSGGLGLAVENAAKARKAANKAPPEVSLHPDFVKYRGNKMGDKVWTMNANPTPYELAALGATVTNINAPHLLADFFWTSPSIPRVTSYEQGIPTHVSYNPTSKEWMSDPLIMDERYLMVNLRGKQVVFSGCSHAGVVNVALDAHRRFPDVPIHWVQGGYHLAASPPEVISQSVKDLKGLTEWVCPGHCTGFRAHAELERAFGDKIVRSVVGARFEL